MCHTGEGGGFIRSSGGAQALRKRGEEEMGDVGRCPTASQKHGLGTREEEDKTHLEVARGQEVPLHQQQMQDQTKQALVTEKIIKNKKKKKKEILGIYKTALFQILVRKWSRTSLTLFPGI